MIFKSHFKVTGDCTLFILKFLVKTIDFVTDKRCKTLNNNLGV